MRILVADTFPENARTELAEQGHDCRYEPGLTADDLPARLAAEDSPEVLIVRSTPVRAAAFQPAGALRFVVRAGTGTNTIDCAGADRNGVHVCNVPGRNAVAVAELTLALLLALDREVPDNVADLRSGNWNKKRYAHARGIAGRRIGVLGLGNIGLAFAERARALGAEVWAVAKPDRSPDTVRRIADIGITLVDDVAELARHCDVLSLHLPADNTTRRILDRDLLNQLQAGSIVLNTARADLVDEQALIEVMEAKGVRAGIDVFADEPGAGSGAIDSALARHPNTYGTHHIGASTQQAQQAVATEVVRMIAEFSSGSVPHRVNNPESAATQGGTAPLSPTAPGGGA